ncbi:MAG: NADH:flavin oxidoreductase [Oligoflexales bacterium]
MQTRHTKLSLNKKLKLKNRLVVPPMASGTADERGYVTTKTLQHYENLTLAGAGLMFVEYSHVDPSGKSEPNQLGIDEDGKIPGLAAIAEKIKGSGAIAGMQITHAGGKTQKQYSGIMWGAGDIAVPTVRGNMEPPTPLPYERIKSFQRYFVDAAIRAYRAGFDILELHCAHGYGINQWLSPLTNNRSDEYGGSLENRTRMLFEIVSAIRQEVPDLALAARVPGQDFLPGGLTNDEMVEVVRQLEKMGLVLIDVSSGLGGWQRPRDRDGQGYLFPEATYIRERIGIPVIGVGGVNDPEFIDKTLEQDRVSLVAVGREILKDPGLWASRFAQGSRWEVEEIRATNVVDLSL